jgi:hypothetical protein
MDSDYEHIPTKSLLADTKRSEYKLQADSSEDSSVYDVQDCYPNKESPVLSKVDESSPVPISSQNMLVREQ